MGMAGSALGKPLATQLPAFDRAAILNYPALPAEITDRIFGTKTPKAINPARPDSLLSQDWALSAIGFFKVFTPLVQPINGAVQACSPEVVVAVVDTGIDYTHQELKDNIWINSGETGEWKATTPTQLAKAAGGCHDKSCNGIDDDANGFVDDVVGWDFVHDVALPFDTHGHGTHIAGIISAAAANGFGITGVCPHATIMPLKYYDSSGLGYNNLNNTVKAIHYAVKMGAQIINYSGGGADPSPSEKAAIEEAERKGILFIAAAGNDGHDNTQTPYFPASYGLDNIISVASINQENHLLPSSNFGHTVNVAAPGLSILSSLPDGRMGTMSGTSQATAFVTGAAALLSSQLKGHGSAFDFRKVKRWITEGVRPMNGNDKKQLLAGGILSLPKALQIEKEELKKSSAPEIALQSRSSGRRN